MRQIFVLTIVMFFALSSSCGTNQAGTGVSNPPTRPSQNLIPDFETAIPETALTAEDDTGAFGSLTRTLTGPAAAWTNIVLEGPIKNSRYFRQYTEAFGDAVLETMTNDTKSGITEEVYSLIFGEAPLVDVEEDWGTVDVSWYDESEEFVKMVVRDDISRIQAYYLVSLDDDENPEKGFFAFVNPELLNISENPNPTGARFFSFTFNLEDSTQNRMLARAEVYSEDDGYFVVWQIHYQCNTETGVCLGEFLEINTNPSTETRAFSPNTLRLKWSEANGSVCAANTTYDGTTTTLGETQDFFGASQPEDADVTTGSCTIDTPTWSSIIYTEDALPTRIEDVNGSEAEAILLTGDGSLDGWEAIITPEAIDEEPFGVF